MSAVLQFLITAGVGSFLAAFLHGFLTRKRIYDDRTLQRDAAWLEAVNSLHRTPRLPDRSREGEEFTAATDCPSCGKVAIHWIDEPRFEPDEPTPMQKFQQSMHHVGLAVQPLTGLNAPARLYDPPGTVVARICESCRYRWGQQ